MLYRLTIARVAAESGRHAEAEETAREAAIVEKTDLLDLHGDVLVDLAEILRLAGREEEARESAEAALDLYLRKGNDVAADRARALLADGYAGVMLIGARRGSTGRGSSGGT